MASSLASTALSPTAATSITVPVPTTMLQPKKTAVDFTVVPVVINVGRPSTTYHANKQLLCDSSEYFRAALGPRWIEGKTGVVNLPDDNADAFNVYLNWIHRKTLCIDFDVEEGEDASTTWKLVVLAYALGDKLLDVDFKDAITDAVAQMCSVKRSSGIYSTPGYHNLAHKLLANDSKLNLLVAHRYARFTNIGDLLKETWPAGLLFNVARELARAAKEKPGETTKDAAARCIFHEHDEGAENCYRTKRIA